MYMNKVAICSKCMGETAVSHEGRQHENHAKNEESKINVGNDLYI